MAGLFEKILIPTDFSDYSRKTVEKSKELDEIGVKEVILFHVGVYDPFVLSLARMNIDDYVEKISDKADKTLNECAKILSEVGLKVRRKFIATSDDPADAIIEFTEEEQVDLIVMGSKGHNWLKQKLLGGVTEEVIRRAKVPVLIMRFKMEVRDGKPQLLADKRIFEKVVFCFDTSDFKEKVIKFMEKIVDVEGDVILLHVAERNKTDGEEIRKAVEKLNKLKSEIEKKSNGEAKIEVKIKHGYPVKEILKESETSSLVVVCSKGKSGEELGKTADSVIRHSKTPVMVFK